MYIFVIYTGNLNVPELCVMNISRCDQTVEILSTHQSLSSTSGVLPIFIVQSILNFSRILWPSNKKSKQPDPDQIQSSVCDV